MNEIVNILSKHAFVAEWGEEGGREMISISTKIPTEFCCLKRVFSDKISSFFFQNLLSGMWGKFSLIYFPEGP